MSVQVLGSDKRCPFHEDPSKLRLTSELDDYEQEWWQVECDCGALGPRALKRVDAIEKWNIRTAPP